MRARKCEAALVRDRPVNHGPTCVPVWLLVSHYMKYDPEQHQPAILRLSVKSRRAAAVAQRTRAACLWRRRVLSVGACDQVYGSE